MNTREYLIIFKLIDTGDWKFKDGKCDWCDFFPLLIINKD